MSIRLLGGRRNFEAVQSLGFAIGGTKFMLEYAVSDTPAALADALESMASSIRAEQPCVVITPLVQELDEARIEARIEAE